jgi:LemA protein
MKSKLVLIVMLGVLAVVVIWGIGRYNAIITAEENVNTAWSQVENQYQRRADLVPNLVETVKGYAAHESETLDNVIAARAKTTQIVLDPTNATAEQIAAFQAAQGELSQALGRLMAVSENYPDLKASQNFSTLRAQ